MHLRYWINVAYPHDSWRGFLSSERMEEAEKLLEHRKARNEQISLCDCLQLCDKRDLVVANAELRFLLQLESKRSATRFLKDAEELRDRVAHSHKEVVAGADWDSVAVTRQKLDTFLEISDKEVTRRVQGTEAPRLGIAPRITFVSRFSSSNRVLLAEAFLIDSGYGALSFFRTGVYGTLCNWPGLILAPGLRRRRPGGSGRWPSP